MNDITNRISTSKWLRFINKIDIKLFASIFITIIVLFSLLLYCITNIANEKNNKNTINATDSIQMELGTEYKQRLSVYNPHVSEISIPINIDRTNRNTCIEVTLYEDDSILQSWRLSGDEVYKGNHVFTLDNIYEMGNFPLYITCTLKSEGSQPVFLNINDSGNYSGLYINDIEKSDSSLCYTINYQYHSLYFYYTIFCMLFIVFTCIFLFFIKKHSKQTGIIILLSFLILGLFYTFANGPFNVPDEPHHFFRAYELSSGEIITPTDSNGRITADFPDGIVEIATNKERYAHNINNVLEDKNLVLGEKTENFDKFWNTAMYPVFDYLPQILGIFLTRLFTSNVWFIFYAGRIFNIIVVGLIWYASYRIIPFGKNALFLVALSPINIIEAASYSVDGICNAIIVFSLAFVLNIRYNEAFEMTPKRIFLMYFLIMIISTIKIVYMPVCLLFLLIPKNRFTKKYSLYVAIGILLIIISFGIWFLIAMQYTPATYWGVNKMLQLSFVLQHPFQFIKALTYTFWSEIGTMLMGLSNNFGWFDINVNMGVSILYLVTLLLHLLPSKNTNNVSRKKDTKLNIISGFLFIFLFFFVYFVEYLSWTPVYSSQIDGMQPRYLVPILMFLFFMFSKNICQREKEPISITNSVLSITLITNIYCAMHIFGVCLMGI